MKLKSIIVDDSYMQRIAIAKLVNEHPNLTLIAEYNQPVEAINGIKKSDIDVVFLDVEMPIINGFQLLESLDNPPQVILITGNPNYALKAFDYEVTDYLYKPISMSRFNAAIKRAVVNHEHTLKLNEEEEYIFVKSNLRQRKVILNNIKWIEALGDYIKLITDEGTIVILSTMKSFEQKLPKGKFMRIHKSYIVNLEKVERYNSKSITVDGSQVPLSRNKKTEFMETLYNQ